MATINRPIKVYNGSGWDYVYPQTMDSVFCITTTADQISNTYPGYNVSFDAPGTGCLASNGYAVWGGASDCEYTASARRAYIRKPGIYRIIYDASVTAKNGAIDFFVQPIAYNAENVYRELLSRQYFKETNEYYNTVQIVVTAKMSAGDYLPFIITRSTANNFRIASGHTKLTIIPVRID